MKILITGFEGFLDYPENPAEWVAREFIGWSYQDWEARVQILPVTYSGCLPTFQKKAEAENPELVVHFGVSHLAQKVTLERVALNLLDSRYPDNEGKIYRETPILENGEKAYFSEMPLLTIGKALLEENQIEVEVSNHAGAYICNYLYYSSQSLKEDLGYESLFIHVPPSQVKKKEYLDTIFKDAAGVVKKLCDWVEEKSQNE